MDMDAKEWRGLTCIRKLRSVGEQIIYRISPLKAEEVGHDHVHSRKNFIN